MRSLFDLSVNLGISVPRRIAEMEAVAEQRYATILDAKSKIAELEAEVAELRRKLGGGCDARGGGDHAVIRQGRYTFCANCGESLRGIRYCHEPRAALAAPDTGDA